MTESTGRRIAVVLAAGRGTRMRSTLPKVLHRAAGRPMLASVLDAARAAGCERILVVVGHGAEQVRAEIGGDDLVWVEQREQRGTGHALAQAADAVARITEVAGVGAVDGAAGSAQLLVLSGDVPLVSAATLERLLAAAAAGWGAMAVADLAHPGALGRVIPAPPAAGATFERLGRIVEAADASPAELALTTINAGLYALPAPDIFAFLAALVPANAQGELYLTDAVTAAAAAGHPVALLRLDDPREAMGVNDRRELAEAHRVLLDRHLDGLMRAGVTVLEPGRTVVEATVRVGADTILHPGVSLLGHTAVGAGCVLHQGAWLRDTRLGDAVTIEPYGVLDGADVGDGCVVGPFARLRPASRLLPGARVDNFIEIGTSSPLAGRPPAETP